MILIWLTDKTSQATVGYALLSVYKLNILRSVTSATLRHRQLQVGNYLCSWTEEESPSIAQSTSGSIRSVVQRFLAQQDSRSSDLHCSTASVWGAQIFLQHSGLWQNVSGMPLSGGTHQGVCQCWAMTQALSCFLKATTHLTCFALSVLYLNSQTEHHLCCCHSLYFLCLTQPTWLLWEAPPAQYRQRQTIPSHAQCLWLSERQSHFVLQ